MVFHLHSDQGDSAGRRGSGGPLGPGGPGDAAAPYLQPPVRHHYGRVYGYHRLHGRVFRGERLPGGLCPDHTASGGQGELSGLDPEDGLSAAGASAQPADGPPGRVRPEAGNPERHGALPGVPVRAAGGGGGGGDGPAVSLPPLPGGLHRRIFQGPASQPHGPGRRPVEGDRRRQRPGRAEHRPAGGGGHRADGPGGPGVYPQHPQAADGPGPGRRGDQPGPL